MKTRFGSTLILTYLFLALVSVVDNKPHQSQVHPGWETQFRPFGFGSNKPHLLFHLGSRDAITHNMAYGYWIQKPQVSVKALGSSKPYSSAFSDLRYKYQNTQQQLYVNVKNHDGGRLIWEEIKDNRYRVESEIKYLYERGEGVNEFGYEVSWRDFRAQIKQGEEDIFNNSRSKLKGEEYFKEFQQGDLMWFVALSVQNNELKLINHQDYLSPVCFTLQRKSSDSIAVHLQQLTSQPNKQFQFQRKQTITFSGQNIQSMQMFGFTVNISQAYQSYNYIDEFSHLYQIYKYPHGNVPRKNESKMVAWENKQIEEIRKGRFQSKYTFVIVYGKVDREIMLEGKQTGQFPKVFVTNSTERKSFDGKKFDIMAYQNHNTLFNTKLAKLQTQQDKQFVSHVIYNLLGGIAYYQGKLYTQNSIMSHQHDYSFSFTPSRLIFPRSFLWDDGFHTTIMATYKPDLTMDVLHSWFKKVDLFGWIGREQIRGFEISSMMPDSRFIYQDVFELNPPTIVMPVLKLLQSQSQLSQSTSLKLQTLLQNHFPSLQKHFRYFIKTQSHFDLTYRQDLLTTIKYRWRCKDECAKGNFMGSGLDDYPRVEAKEQISKEHIDLSSWLWFFSDALQNIAQYLQKDKAARFYNRWKHSLREKIIQECLDESDMLFKDLAVKGPKLFLDQKVTKIGYINLFPFFVGLLQTYQSDSEGRTTRILQVLNKTVSIMMDEKILMSEGGIRSLSLNDTDYASEQNYWRGASWMPINYMVLRACKKYYWDITSQPHRKQVHQLYNVLREKLINAVEKNYRRSGYLFENYIEGEGNRGYPFYGWTSLIADIITEDY